MWTAAVAAIILASGPAVFAAELPVAPIDVSSPVMQAAAGEVSVADNAFQPAEVRAQTGTTVVWRQTGNNPHSVTADDGSFDSHSTCPPLCMRSGDTFARTFDRPGRHAYYCRVHGGRAGLGMAGVIVVEATGTTANAVGTRQEAGLQATSTLPAGADSVGPGATSDSLAATGGPGVARISGAVMLLCAVAFRRVART